MWRLERRATLLSTHLNVVSSPGGVPEPPGGDAGQAAAQQGAAEGRAVETVGILADQAGATPGAVTTLTEQWGDVDQTDLS